MKKCSIVFSKCTPDLTARMCENCRTIINDPDASCDRCNTRYDFLKPVWRFYFRNDDKAYPYSFIAIGDVLDNIMSMTINDFLYLKDKLSEIDWEQYISNYFLNFQFLIEYDFQRIRSINLPVGCSLDFINWICLNTHIGLERDMIKSIILGKALFGEEEEEM